MFLIRLPRYMDGIAATNEAVEIPAVRFPPVSEREYAMFVVFAIEFRRRDLLSDDNLRLVLRFLAETAFPFTPQNALGLRVEVRRSDLMGRPVGAILDAELDGILRFRDLTGDLLSVDLSSVLLRQITDVPFDGTTIQSVWSLDTADIGLPEEREGCVVHSGFVRPFDGLLWLNVRDPTRHFCFEINVCRHGQRMHWRPRILHACMDC